MTSASISSSCRQTSHILSDVLHEEDFMFFLSLVIKHKLGALSGEERVRRTLHLAPAVVAAVTSAAIDSIGTFEQRAVVTITLRRNHVELLV